MSERSIKDLQMLQALPLEVKIKKTQQRIREWINEYGRDGVYVSFSGGKDSTVLVDIITKMGFEDIPLVFVDTGLEYPEIRQFVKSYGDRVVWLKPKKTFKQVIEEYGYPFISKEVSECVFGARKYLTQIMETESLKQASKQASYSYYYQKLTGTGKYSKFSVSPIVDKSAMTTGSRGGYDNKYRKLRGIGEYSKQEQRQGFDLSVSEIIGNVNKQQRVCDSGEYP